MQRPAAKREQAVDVSRFVVLKRDPITLIDDGKAGTMSDFTDFLRAHIKRMDEFDRRLDARLREGERWVLRAYGAIGALFVYAGICAARRDQVQVAVMMFALSLFWLWSMCGEIWRR
jgi:hypothetical protein